MMFIPELLTPYRPRRGVVLLVVMALLSLFAAVGLSFVFYADSESTASQYFREAANKVQADIDPELLLAYFLGQLIYDVDDTAGVYSAMRGHSLARNMYGYGLGYGYMNSTPYSGIGRAHYNVIPTSAQNFPGFTSIPPDNVNLVNSTCYNSYYYYNAGVPLSGTPISDGFILDPERYNATPRALLTGWGTAYQTPQGGYLSGAQGTFVGANPAYTYPDVNNMFLAAVNANGEVLLPSFHRPWLPFNTSAGTQYVGLDPTNGNWTSVPSKIGDPAFNPWLKYMVMRPRPAENPGFPLPEDAGGDVKNLDNGPGTKVVNPATGVITYYNNDSIWIDLGFPVITAPNGQKFKPLFAPLIIDLDGKLNLNMHGNIRGQDNNGNLIHASNQGWGPWEVNLGWVFNDQTLTPQEWVNIFNGMGNSTLPAGRYMNAPSRNQQSSPGNAAGLIGATSPSYAMADLDGVLNPAKGNNTLGNKSLLPGENGNGNNSYYSFPYFDTTTYGNGSAAELTNNPAAFSFFSPANRIFDWSHAEQLLRFGGQGSPALTSDLMKLLPRNFITTQMIANVSGQAVSPIQITSTQAHGLSNGRIVTVAGVQGNTNANGTWIVTYVDQTNFTLAPLTGNGSSTGNAPAIPQTGSFYSPWRTRLVGTHSFDLDIPGVIPWLNPNDANTYQKYDTKQSNGNYYYYTGKAVSFPATTAAKPPGIFPTSPAGEFASDWRSQPLFVSNKVNTNINNPTQALNTVLGRANMNRLLSVEYTGADSQTGLYLDPKSGQLAPGFQLAQLARQQLAQDIFNVLRYVATGNLPGVAFPKNGSNEWNALQSLAQLAVNIVDYLDDDDYVTPFNWVPTDNTQYVYGTEIPKVIINEAYSEVINDPTDTFMGKGKKKRATKDYKINFYAELLNTMPSVAGATNYNVQLYMPTGGNNGKAVDSTGKILAAYPMFKLDVVTSTGTPSFSDTALGTPNNIKLEVSDFTPAPAASVNPITGQTYIVPTAAVANYINANGTQYSGTSASNSGFYVIGPIYDLPNIHYGPPPNPPAPASLQQATLRVNDYVNNGVRNSMTYEISDKTPKATYKALQHNFVLRRLACPYLPEQKDPTDPNKTGYYNPYVTVDYTPSFTPYDGVAFTTAGAHVGDPLHSRFTSLRKQPYGASQVKNAVGQPIKAVSGGKVAPMQLTVTNHGYQSGDQVYVQGTGDAKVDNKTWTVTVLGANKFALNGAPPHKGKFAANNNSLVFYADRLQHTFFRHNGVESANPTAAAAGGPWNQTLQIPFNWLVHLDRNVISAMELLHVSLYPPYMLTQNFVNTAGKGSPPYAHTGICNITDNTGKTVLQPVWFNSQARIYRALEYLDASLRGATATGGNPAGMRMPGKININTIYDLETFLALCDPNQMSCYYSSQAQANQAIAAVYQNMVNSRTKTTFQAGPFAGNSTMIPSNSDVPFMSLATGYSTGDNQFQNGISIENTLLRSTSSDPTAANVTSATTNRLFGIPTTANGNGPSVQGTYHPYRDLELLTKIHNNVTTRSNVFGCWLTVGFFAVTDTDANGNVLSPPQLGQEIGRTEGRNIRHRMFALIDRSNLLMPSALPSPPALQAITGSNTPQTVPVQAVPGNWPAGNIAFVNSPNGVLRGAGQLVGTSAAGGTYKIGSSWQIQVGSVLLVNGTQTVNKITNPVQETVTVTAVDTTKSPPTITATFVNSYDQGSISFSVPGAAGPTVGNTSTVFGNPGPQPYNAGPQPYNSNLATGTWFDPRQNTAVVPYFSIIK